MNTHSRLIGCGVVMAILLLARASHAQTFQVTDLGLLGGSPTFATAINDNGAVCGYAQIDAGTTRAWVSTGPSTGMRQLPDLGGTDTKALAIGSDDMVYGYGTDAGGLPHALLWPTSISVIDLGTVSGTEGLVAQGIGAGGVIVGNTGTASAPLRAFKFSPAFAIIPPLAGAPAPSTCAAYGINGTGQIVGFSNWVGGGTRAFRTDAGGVPASLGTLGANDSTAMSINTAGDVAGYSVNASNQTHAFLFTDTGGMRDLGVIPAFAESRALGVNDTGLVVGSSEDSAGNARAFLWLGSGSLIDLNPLIPPNSGWVLNEAQDINAGGDIVGNGMIGGVPHAFILERFEGADTLAPVVSGSVTTFNGTPSNVVTVNFWDNEKIIGATTHASGLIRITGPNGYNTYATVQSWYGADRQSSTSTFIYTAPGGSWDGADNGVYEIRLSSNVVTDLAGNLHPGGVIGTFTVGMQTTPVLNWITLPSTATAGVAVNLSFGAFGSYPASAGDLFAVAVDWDGDGVAIEAFPSRVTNATIPHTFTSIGTHTVRVRVTDPNGLQSSERTAAIAVSNSNVLPLLAEDTGAVLPSGVGAGGAAATIQAGKLYLFGTSPWANAGEEIPIYTWNFLPGGVFNASAPFLNGGHMDIGPLTPEWAAIDGQNRIVVYRAEGGSTYTTSGGVGGNIAAKPGGYFAGASAVDSTGRYYALSGLVNNHRYSAGASGAGIWTALPALPAGFTPATASYDGAGRIIVFGGTSVYALNIVANTWTQLTNSPVSFYGSATLGADGFIYLLSGTNVWTFDPAANFVTLAGVTAIDHTSSPAVLGSDGFIYLIGGYNGQYYTNNPTIARIDTRPASQLRAPRITSAPTGITLAQGTPWTYQIAAAGKPSPSFSLVRGPASMSVGGTSGLVSWTPTLAQVGTQFAVVRASNSVGVSEQLITFNVLGTAPDTTPPSAVTGLAAYNITLNSADLAWSASTDNIGVTGYRMLEQRTSGNRWHRVKYFYTIGTTTGLSWHLGALPVGSTKTWFVAAIDAAGNQSTPTPVTVSLIAPPVIYADQSGTFSGARAIVNEVWTGNAFTAYGNPMPALSPSAFPAGAAWHSTAANVGFFTWTPVAGQEGTQTFTVSATNSGGSSILSRTVTVYPAGTDLIPPSSPGSLTVDQVSFDSCRATWTAATDNYGVVGYRVAAVHREPRRRYHRGAYDDHVVAFDVPAGTTQVVFPGLRPSTSYVVSVNARDAAGLYGYALTRDIRTLPKPFEISGTALTQTLNPDGTVTLSWAGLGYYWKFTVQCSADLVNWQPVPPANQWSNYTTTFIFNPATVGVPCQFFRVLATAAATP